jgi:hypothetical protein
MAEPQLARRAVEQTDRSTAASAARTSDVRTKAMKSLHVEGASHPPAAFAGRIGSAGLEQ